MNNHTNTHHRRKITRLIAWIAAEILALTTAVSMLPGGFNEGLLLALITPLMLLLPKTAEKLLHCRLELPLYLFALFYALGPMLGQCWKLYYLTNWWDKLLHISGGILFALVGWMLFRQLSGAQANRVATTLFALCFSVSLAAIWEFFEFAADQLFYMDMQNDTIVYSFPSYFLGNSPGMLGGIDSVKQVFIDGIPLPFSGYLDIGLQDTMWDMILESLGALVTAGFCFFTNGQHLGIGKENHKHK